MARKVVLRHDFLEDRDDEVKKRNTPAPASTEFANKITLHRSPAAKRFTANL